MPASPVCLPSSVNSDEQIRQQVRDWIAGEAFPCLGAKSVLRRGTETILVLDELGTRSSATQLLDALVAFAARDSGTDAFAALLAAFRRPRIADERQFERLLWRQLHLVRSLDAAPWDPEVSDDPNNENFGFSAGCAAYFVVGMHPVASRLARRAPLPLLAFNPHRQFRRLRAEGRYSRFRDTIRRRDVELQGSVNPMLADHGDASEARQYAGRLVTESWHAPFGDDVHTDARGHGREPLSTP